MSHLVDLVSLMLAPAALAASLSPSSCFNAICSQGAEVGTKPLSAGAEWWGMTFRKMPSFSFANVLLPPWKIGL